jgi:hypothetical protein
MSIVKRLTEELLRDRERAKQREMERPRSTRERSDFDPFSVNSWVVPAGSSPGYLPSTPMRKGPVGFYVSCKSCGSEFESKGLAYCPACMELPAEERRIAKPAFIGRLCQGPGCENFVSRGARADAIYCSKCCRDRAHRARRAADNRAGLPDIGPPKNETDNDKKD